ncbi:MAG: HAD-IB family hydrolase [Janthinobacterium lividum]
MAQDNGLPKEIVAFDFDGTLSIRDSFTDFLKWRAGPAAWALGMVKLIPAAMRYVFDRDRGAIKAASVEVFLKGVSREQLAADAERYMTTVFEQFMRPDALACWNDWGAKGVHRVIVTASPEITIAPFAKRLGAENLIGTRLEFDANDRITGRFASANCRCGEKVDRIRAVYGNGVRILAAYGDTSGDEQMIAAAEEKGFQVFTAKP